MAKGISISLAAKCQLLFGLAVLVIITGALAVPWQRMEQLAGQQNIKAARMVADLTFRQVHMQPATTQPLPGAGEAGREGAGSSATAPAAQSAARWRDISLVDLPDYPPPRILVLPEPQGNLGAEDSIAQQALLAFRARTQETEYGREVTLPDKDRTRLYRYAAAVRLDSSCLSCHPQWTGWVRPQAATEPAAGGGGGPATRPAPSSWPVVALVRVDLPWQVDDNQQLLNRIVLVVAGMLGGTLAIMVFYLITSRLILQPVRVLRNTAEKVSKGDLNIRSAISTGDEFQQLSETFNRMLATLKASQDQLEATNRSLDTRVGELAQSNVDLYEANRLKSEFLTNVSHELRTPLNAIIGFAELLAENPVAADTKVGRYVENVRVSAKQLLDLINDLLDLAKIEAGKLVLRQEKVNVADVCEAMLNFMRPLAQKKNIDLQCTIEGTIPLVTTDPGRFQQVLYNFLSNAVKFTPPDGNVRILARNEDADTVRIAVSDSGPGIPPEHQQQIFEKFRQLDGSVTRQHSGSGLGLAISRELAHMLGGRIELVSTPGKGATFSLIVPVELGRKTVEVHPTLENA